MTRSWVLVCLAGLSCNKAQPPVPSGPSPEVQEVLSRIPPRDAPLPPVDAEGWPIGWPEAGVVIVTKDGSEGSYVPGRIEDRAKAERWGGAKHLTTEQLLMIRRAGNRDWDLGHDTAVGDMF
ncbi:MAG: hypothetical protein ACKVPX_10010 [Myxococcaceae bacterium]